MHMSWCSGNDDERGFVIQNYIYFCNDHIFIYEGFSLVTLLFFVNSDVIMAGVNALKEIRKDLNRDALFEKYTEILRTK
jgi:hypothetical protein